MKPLTQPEDEEVTAIQDQGKDNSTEKDMPKIEIKKSNGQMRLDL